MVAGLRARRVFHIVPSRFPVIGIFDGVADAGDLEAVLALESATNPRVLDEAGSLSLVRPEDRISGPGSTPVMASFTHGKPSRFCDGSFGVFYGAFDEPTAIAETAFHRERFLRNAGFTQERLDMRVYRAEVSGRYDDLRTRTMRSKLFDPNSYAASQQYAARLYAANTVDGIVYRSVRRREGTCVAAFRPRRVARCVAVKHLEYRFEGGQLRAVMTVDARTA